MSAERIKTEELSPGGYPPFLAARPQWMCWVLLPGKAGRRARKLALRPASRLSFEPRDLDYTDSSNWGSLDEAWACWRLHPERVRGIGFCFAPSDDTLLIDLDHVVENGLVSSAAWDLIGLLNYPYTEVSSSGTGLHVLLRSAWQGRCVSSVGVSPEVYGAGHWVAFTGRHVQGTAREVEPRPGEVFHLERQFFPTTPIFEHRSAQRRARERPLPLSDSPSSPVPRVRSDVEALEWMLTWKSAAKISALLAGDVVAAGFAHADGSPDRSRADFALAQALLIATGGDLVQAERLFINTGLFRPEKWHRRASHDGLSYGQVTLRNAAARLRPQ